MINPNQLASTQRARRGSLVGSVLALVGALVLSALPAQAAIINVPANQSTIQAAINAANPGDEVVVAPGTYAGGINFNGKAITVRSTDPTNPAVVAATIISFGGTNPVVRCISGEGPNSVLNGLVIRDGAIVGNGGGMSNVNSSPTVTNCTFIENFSLLGNGGGMSNVNSSPTVTNCTFTNNEALNGFSGGGMYNSGGSPTVTNCTFTGNSVDAVDLKEYGGGMYNSDSNATVTNCTFTGNYGYLGGGIASVGSIGTYVTLTNCTIRQNSATFGGGVYGGFDNVTTLRNCTISQNSAARGGGIYGDHAGKTELWNCTVSGNSASSEGSAVYAAPRFHHAVLGCLWTGAVGAHDSTFCGGGTLIVGIFFDFDNFIGPVCPSMVDTDGDGVLDSNDVCPNNRPGLPVDSTGRPHRDCNHDCLYDAADIQCLVDEMLSL